MSITATVLPPEKRRFGHIYQLQTATSEPICLGALTYEVKAPKTSVPLQREIILVDDNKLNRNTFLTSQSQRDRYEEFKNGIRQNIQKDKKAATIELKKKAAKLMNHPAPTHPTVPAIYKHGAIPVFITEVDCTLQTDRAPRKVKIAIMPPTQRREYEIHQEGTASASTAEDYDDTGVLIRNSYYHQTLLYNLPLYFTKYLEDVASIFEDIMSYSNPANNCITRSKNIEIILGTSLTTKLEAVKIALERAPEISPEDHLHWLLATAAREYLLLLANDFYQLCGINPRNYERKLRAALEQIEKSAELTPSTLESALVNLFRRYLEEDEAYFSSPEAENPFPFGTWANQVWRVSAFLFSIKKEMAAQRLRPPLDQLVIYLSGASEAAAQKLMDQYGNAVGMPFGFRIITEAKTPGGEKVLCWLADAVYTTDAPGTLFSPLAQESIRPRAEEMGKALLPIDRAKFQQQLESLWRKKVINVLQSWLYFAGSTYWRSFCLADLTFINRFYHAKRIGIFMRRSEINGMLQKPPKRLFDVNRQRLLTFGAKRSGQKDPFYFLHPSIKPTDRQCQFRPNLYHLIDRFFPNASPQKKVEIYYQVLHPMLPDSAIEPPRKYQPKEVRARISKLVATDDGAAMEFNVPAFLITLDSFNQEIFDLYVLGFSIHGIASRLKMKESAVEDRLARIRLTLRHYLGFTE